MTLITPVARYLQLETVDHDYFRKNIDEEFQLSGDDEEENVQVIRVIRVISVISVVGY